MKYPIGIQTFSILREENYLYIDKTELIFNLVNQYKFVFLSRPRRFGKSLLLSTIRSYFEGRKELFEGLAIEHLEKEWRKHPVLRFDLSGQNYDHPDKLLSKIDFFLAQYEREYAIEERGSIADRFANLITSLSSKGSKVVVLIDEYDKPLLDSLHDDALHDSLKRELRGFYGVMKQCDEYIRFAMLTGITKFGKINIFSGLNNLEDITLNPDYNAICGISEKEFRNNFQLPISEFAKTKKIPEEEAWKLFKDNYDGYRFSEKEEGIYNPFCVLLAFSNKKLRNYWFESGSPSHLISILQHNHFDLNQLNNPIRTASQLNDIGSMDKDLVPLLYQAGYLTIKDYYEEDDAYLLGIPNLEVSRSLWNSLIDYFFTPLTTPRLFAIENFRESLESGDVDNFMKRLRSLMSDTNSEHEPDKEIHFQNMMAIFAKLLGYTAVAEYHSARGRCDLTVETPRFIYIFEFKIDSTAQEALQQIKDRGYAERFEVDPREKILVGVNFSTKLRTIDDWLPEII